MKFLKRLKELFSGGDKYEYPQHFVVKFANVDDFIEYVAQNICNLSNHYIYYYKGYGNTLFNLISSEKRKGEKEIRYIDLEFAGECECIKNNLILYDTLFFCDTVPDVFRKFNEINVSEKHKCKYVSNITGYHDITNFVIAKENVYLCEK